MALPAGGGTPADTTVPIIVLQPTPADVHQLLPHRQVWSVSTTPSLADIQGIIDRLTGELGGEFPTVPVTVAPVATAYLTYAAASLIETTYNPEQQFGENSPSALYDQRAGAALTRLRGLADGRARNGSRLGTVQMLPPEYEDVDFAANWR